MEKNKEKPKMEAGVKSFITAIVVIFAMMVLTYALTIIIPGGYIPFWKWILSPILVLFAKDSGSMIAIIALLVVLGGIFNTLDKFGVLRLLLDKVTAKFGKSRRVLLAVIPLFFMVIGSAAGTFEECVPLVPVVVALAIRLGWDALTGLGMSILAAGCGFAAGVCNPFTIGVAQELAGLPMFSGVWMRLISFGLIYLLLLGFLRLYTKKIEKPLEIERSGSEFKSNQGMDRGLWCFVIILGIGIAAILCSGFIKALQDYTMIIVAVMFLAAGITASLVSGMSGKELGKTALSGVVSMLPAVVMILMASSIRYTLEEANILDTILHGAMDLAQNLPKWAVVEFIYLLVLGMNFFIPSGSAKAFMLIPLIVPLAQMFGISAQLCVLAFAFGDGFSNVFYPTNPALLIGLGLADVSYGDWFKWSGKFQVLNLLLTALLLLAGLWIGY